MKISNNQTGAALFTALIFLLILTVLGATALRNSGLSERMSTNSQISNMAFNAAESAMDRYIAEYNYNVAATAVGETNINLKTTYLAKYLPIATATSFYEYCLDDSSTLIPGPSPLYPLDTNAPPCGTTTLDGTQNAVIAKNRVEYEGCIDACPGYSFGGDISCHVLKMEADGTVDQTTVSVDQWVTLLGPC
ncbi:MAG: hypothetical protein ACI9N9_001928 [Enterobacterales bacterium]|jgi:hypothetical protein